MKKNGHPIQSLNNDFVSNTIKRVTKSVEQLAKDSNDSSKSYDNIYVNTDEMLAGVTLCGEYHKLTS